MSAKEIKEKYEQFLEPEEFLTFKQKGVKNYSFWFDCLCEFFKTKQFTGNRLLDLGSGPTVHNVATASSYFSEIVLSDLVDKNCKALKKWLAGDSDRLDWTPFLEMVAKAEKRSDVGAAVQEIERRIRNSVKAVTNCDLLNDQVIPLVHSKEPFDLILTALTLQTAAVDLESYRQFFGRINGLLKTGGRLIMMGTTHCTFWKVGDNTFHSYPVTHEELQTALEASGFGDIEVQLSEQPDPSKPFDCEELYFVTSVKL